MLKLALARTTLSYSLLAVFLVPAPSLAASAVTETGINSDIADSAAVVGLVYPLVEGTYDGYRQRDAAAMAVADLNANGGALGRPIRLLELGIAEEVSGGGCTEGQVTQQLQQFVDASADDNIALAFTSSECASPFDMDIFGEAGVLQITGLVSQTLTETAAAKGMMTYFRVSQGWAGTSDAMLIANYLAEYRSEGNLAIIPPLGVVFDGSAQIAISQYLMSVKNALNQNGIQERLYMEDRNDYIDYGLFSRDYSAILERLRDEQIDVVILSAVGNIHDVGFLTQLRDEGMQMEIILIGLSPWDDGAHPNVLQLVEEAGTYAEGTLTILPFDPCAAFEATEVFARYMVECSIDGVNTYASIQLWAEAVEVAGSFEADLIAQVLRERTIGTILGELSFDAKGDPDLAFRRMHVRTGGEFVSR